MVQTRLRMQSPHLDVASNDGVFEDTELESVHGIYQYDHLEIPEELIFGMLLEIIGLPCHLDFITAQLGLRQVGDGYTVVAS